MGETLDLKRKSNMKQTTTDIKFCAYLRLKGVNPDDVNVIRKGKAEYIYEISDEEWIEWKQEFNKSSFIEYANCLNAIKDLAY